MNKKTLLILFIINVLEVINIITKNIYNEYLYILIWFVVLIILIINTGFIKIKNINEKIIIEEIIIYAFLYLIIIYLLGIKTSFLKTGNSLEIKGIIKNIVPVILIIILQELIRYKVVSNIKKNKLSVILLILSFILFEVILNLNKYNLNSIKDIFKLFALVITPSITKNILLTYLVNKYGYRVTITYRLILELYIYLIPIIPNFGAYLKSILNFIFPLILLIKYNNKYKSKVRFKNKLSTIFVILILTIVIYLVSGLFSYYALTVATGSMENTIKIGDVVIVKKISSEKLNILDIKDILVHRYLNNVIVHRIIDIDIINNEYYFHTKGDNNKEKDSYIVDKNGVIGKAVFKIPYIGYPSIWLNNLVT